VEEINTRSQQIDNFDELRRSSLDFYAAIRSLYQQKRAADVQNAKTPSAPSVPGVPYGDTEPSTPAPSNPPAQ
jgi:phospholipid-binding lipoprotein MlaA